MPRLSEEQIRQARSVDLLDCLQAYEPSIEYGKNQNNQPPRLYGRAINAKRLRPARKRRYFNFRRKFDGE